MKKLIMALMGIIIATATANVMAQDMTVYLKNGTSQSFTADQIDSVVYVGTNPQIGIKVYYHGNSTDFLFSQIDHIETSAVVPSAPTFSHASGTNFTEGTTISISAPGSVIYYTFDGTDPSAEHYSGYGTDQVFIALSQGTTTIKAVAKAGANYSSIVTATYTVTPQTPLPTFETLSGTTFDAATTVYVDGPDGYVTYVTTTASGAIPSSSYYQAIGTGRIAVQLKDGVNYINARSYKDGEYSETVKAVYYVKPAPPTFSIPSGTTVAAGTTLRITGTSTQGVMIYATTDGTTPTATNNQIWGTTPLDMLINEDMTIKAVVIAGDVSSDVATATYTIEQVDNNLNRNSLSPYYDASKHMYNLEWPRINETDNNTWVEKSTSKHGITFAVEWSNTIIANRFTCYQMNARNDSNLVARKDAFAEDPDLPAATRSKLSDYSGSGFSRGHLCPSADRLCSRDQNSQTFFLSNMQPQWQSHNGGIWAKFEGYVRSQWYPRVDTLYIVKGATISDVTIDEVTSSGIHDYMCNNRLVVPKYFYMAFLGYKVSTGKYEAFAIWTTHDDDAQSGVTARQCTITIDELERRTGIDFFCNLPDDIEVEVERAVDYSYWGL